MTEVTPVYYHDYLQLDRLLDAQQPVTERDGAVVHDEVLFIIVHQAYELWFKEILYELDSVIAILGENPVPDRGLGLALSRLERIVQIQRVLMDHIDVLETMTAADFMDFRDSLAPASGFQSVQFRLIENRFGLDPDNRLDIDNARYTSRLSPEHRELVEESESLPTLHDRIENWLEQQPFLERGDSTFWSEYGRAVNRMLERERLAIESHPSLDETGRTHQLARHEASRQVFATIFDAERYEQLRREGRRRISRRAFIAALLIHLYRHEPIVQLPYRILSTLVDIDERFVAWRQRHALMVMRMIGDRIGTGGTSGHDYLEQSAARSRVFRDLVAIPTFLIPSSELPALPDEIMASLGFRLGAVV